MRNGKTPKNSDFPPYIKGLLDAANSASQTAAALHVAFIGFMSYLGVIFWGTTHEDLLLISPVKLPILDVELPLTTFYGGVPWLLILLHFNLLIQLELLSRKLWNLDKALPDSLMGQQVRDCLFIFPFSHLIAGRSDVQLIRWVLSLVVGLTVIALPLLLLFAAQIRFLPFHDETITWIQRVAVWADALILLILWPLIATANDRAKEWWGAPWCKLSRLCGQLKYGVITRWNALDRSQPKLRLRKLPVNHHSKASIHPNKDAKGIVILLLSVCTVVPLSVISLIPGSLTVEAYMKSIGALSNSVNQEVDDKNAFYEDWEKVTYFEDWLINHVPKSWLVGVDDQIKTDMKIYKVNCRTLDQYASMPTAFLKHPVTLSWNCKLFGLARNLDLTEARLIPQEVFLHKLNQRIEGDEEFHGLKLKYRDLRFANFAFTDLTKADLRFTKLQSANFFMTSLYGANISNANLMGADFMAANLLDADLNQSNLRDSHLGGANLKGANLVGVNLQGVNLTHLFLQGVNLSGSQMEGTNLSKANLKAAYLMNVNLQGADLSEANLQGADLSEANLQGADLSEANLQGADLSEANLQGADLSEANLQGADLSEANLQGADLSEANLQGADLSEANLQGLGLTSADLQGVDLTQANLQGTHWSRADLDAVILGEMPESNVDALEQKKLEAKLKPILDKERFTAFQERLKKISSGKPLGEPDTKTGCMSLNPDWLKCEYGRPAQFAIYHAHVLIPKLIELACDDFYVLKGLMRFHSKKRKGLAAALLQELSKPKPCAGLARLSVESRISLEQQAKYDKQEIKSD